jgi:hypothetical protein
VILEYRQNSPVAQSAPIAWVHLYFARPASHAPILMRVVDSTQSEDPTRVRLDLVDLVDLAFVALVAPHRLPYALSYDGDRSTAPPRSDDWDCGDAHSTARDDNGARNLRCALDDSKPTRECKHRALDVGWRAAHRADVRACDLDAPFLGRIVWIRREAPDRPNVPAPDPEP